MGVPKKLTDMQKRFVELLVYGDPKTGEPLNQTEAAKLAGYAHKMLEKRLQNYAIPSFLHWLLPTKDN